MLDADEAYFKEHNEPLFSSHMIDLSEESVEENVSTTAKYLKRAAPMVSKHEDTFWIALLTRNRSNGWRWRLVGRFHLNSLECD